MKQFRIKQLVKRIGERDEIYLQDSIKHEQLGKIIDDMLENSETVNIEICLSDVVVITK